MGRSIRAMAFVVLAMLAPCRVALSQPAPPPPPGMPDYIGLLERSFNERDIAAYASLFTENVTVFVDGSLVASDRASYMKIIQAEFDQNIHISTLSWAQGSQLLVMQMVSGCIPLHPNPGTIYHGCQWAIAARYDLASDGKMASVHILDARQAWNMHATGE